MGMEKQLGIIAGTSMNFVLSSRFIFDHSALTSLDPSSPPWVIAEEVLEELKADWLGLIRAENLFFVAQASTGGTATAMRQLTPADKSTIKLVLATSQPTFLVTGPKRLPQARTNTRWASSLAVPVCDGCYPVGVVYTIRNSTEEFVEEDLHWLTAYVSTSGPVFSLEKTREPAY